MKKKIIFFVFIFCLISMYCIEYDFCDHTILVVLKPEFSAFDSSLVADITYPVGSVETCHLHPTHIYLNLYR